MLVLIKQFLYIGSGDRANNPITEIGDNIAIKALFVSDSSCSFNLSLSIEPLSRSVSQFCDILEIVKQKHLRLVIIGSITVDCRNSDMDPMSEAFLQMASIFNQLELSMIRARIKSGMANAREKGKQIGRSPVTKADLPAVFIKYYPSYMNGTMNVSELARICGLSRPTIYKYIKMVG